MAGELELDPDEVRQHAGRLADLGDRVGRTYSGLREALAYAAGCWGDDRLGTAFAEGFEPYADQLLAGQQAMEKGLYDTAAAMRSAGDEFTYGDQFGGDRVAEATDDLPGTPLGDTTSNPSFPPTPSPVVQRTVSSPAPARPAEEPASGFPGPSEGSASGFPSPVGGSFSGSQSPVGEPASGTRNPSGTQAAQRVGSQSSNPAAETTNRRGGPTSTESPDRRRSRPAPVSAPIGRDAPRNPAITARPNRPSDAAPGRTPVGTTTGRTPWSSPAPGTPGAQPTPGSSPHNSAPPVPRAAPARPGDPRRDTPQQRTEEPPRRSPLFAWLAQMLAQRHGVEVVGFDLPDLQELPVREFVAAVDRVLTDYPMIVVDVVAVADVGTDTSPVCWRRETSKPGAARSITLDQRTACASSGPATEADSAVETERSRLYADTVRAFGPALDHAGGGAARAGGQRALIAEYMRGVAGRYTTLAQLLGGYRQWRAELIGATTETGRFDMGRALGAGFAEVVLRGSQASAPARTLHTLLVDAAPHRA